MAFRREKKRIGDMLINENVITQEQLEKALPIAKEKHKKIGETLIELGFTNELEIAKALSQQLGLELVNVSAINIPEEVQNLVSETVLRKHVMIPYAFDKNNANIVHVAMADPMDMVALDDFSIVTNLQVEPAVATGRDILLTLDKYYGDTNPTGEAGTDSSSGSSSDSSTTDSSNADSSQSSQTADGNSSQSQTGDGSAADGSTSTGSAKSTVTGYQLYDVSTVMAFKTEYHGLKAMLGEVIGSSQKKTISTLNVSFDDSTGKLTGEMLVDSYFLYGLDKPYEAPYIPAVPHGTNNLFGTTN